MTTALVPFTYADLDPALADRPRSQAERIRQRIEGQTQAMIETGRDLTAVKDNMAHGTFLAWVEAECGISPRLAQMYMRAAEWSDENAKSISLLPPTVVLKLSSKSVPDGVRQDIVKRFEAG